MNVAALYVEKDGPYSGLPGVDVWDEKRDARGYNGPWPVVAHPPCQRWCRFAKGVEKQYPHYRVSYEEHVGEIPDGHVLHHICRQPACTNPVHLQALTPSEHRKLHALEQTHCRNGHLLAGDNLYEYVTKLGRLTRLCRACDRERRRVRYHAAKAAGASPSRGHCQQTGGLLSSASSFVQPFSHWSSPHPHRPHQ